MIDDNPYKAPQSVPPTGLVANGQESKPRDLSEVLRRMAFDGFNKATMLFVALLLILIVFVTVITLFCFTRKWNFRPVGLA
jgi:hypothetical protein